MEIAHSTSIVRTPAYHGPGVRSSDMEIACWRLTVRTAIPLGPDARKPYMEITCSGRATVQTIVPHRPDAVLKQERFSAKISKIMVSQLSVRTTLVHRLDGTRIFHCSCPFEPQPINRGPWALRTKRIRYWIPLELREYFVRLLELICSLYSRCCVLLLRLTEIYLRGSP
jgi:hypothetical protein